MAGSTIEASIEQVRPFVERMLGTSAPDGSGAQMKSRTDEIIGALKQANLAYTERMPNRRVIANPLNRDGQGVDPYDVHSLLERIWGAGWSYSKTVDAVCFELPPDPAFEVQFNLDLAQSAAGMLPAVDVANCRVSAVGCTRAVHALGAVNESCNSFLTDLCVDGRLSREKVLAVCPQIQDALDNGLMWTVIRHEVHTAFPLLADFVQEGLNAVHGAERQKTQIQALMAIHSKAVQNYKRTGSYRWSAIAKQMERSNPHLDYGAAALRLRRSVERTVSSQTVKFLADLEYASGPEWPLAILKASLVAPDSYVDNGASKLVSSSDIGSVHGSNKASVAKFVTMCRAAKKWVADLLRRDDVCERACDLNKALGDFEVRSVMTILGKKARSRLSFNTIDEVGSEFIATVLAASPTVGKVAPPWDYVQAAPKASASKAASKTEAAMGTFVQGQLDKDTIAQQGFEVGREVDGATVKLAPTEPQPKLAKAAKLDDEASDGEEFEGTISVSSGALVDNYK
ncbi:unnamed protein product, partial [Prorocentrum cordatum]